MKDHFTVEHHLKFTSFEPGHVEELEDAAVIEGSVEAQGYCSAGRNILLLCSTTPSPSDPGCVGSAFVCAVLDDEDVPPCAVVEMTRAPAARRFPVTVPVPISPYLDGGQILKFAHTAERWPGRWRVRYREIFLCVIFLE